MSATLLSTNAPGSVQLQGLLKHRRDIDGLRAIAISSVVFYHTGSRWCRGGFVGVDVFFVISGYLIGSLVYKDICNSSFSIARFYQRRAKRILPALFAVLTFSYVMAALLFSPLELWRFGSYALATVTSSSNIMAFLKSGYFEPKSELNPLLMTWSLGVEEQFYILFPLLMLLMQRRKWTTQFLTVGVLAALSLAASAVGTRNSPNAAFYLLPFRAWELAAGVLLAIYEANRSQTLNTLPPMVRHGLGIFGVLLIIVSIFAFSTDTQFPGFAALLPVLGAVLVIAGSKGVMNRLLGLQPIAFVGLVSYSWYLWHWPLLSFARVSSDSGLSIYSGFVIAVGSFGLAVLSYKLVEQPFRRSGAPPVLSLKRYAAVGMTMTLPAVAMYFAPKLPPLNRSVQQLDLAVEAEHWDPCLAGDAEEHPRLTTPCVPSGPERTVALLGDSRSTAISEAIRVIANRSGYQLMEMNHSACPMLDGVSRSQHGVPSFFHHCGEYNRERLQYVTQDSRVEVVILAAAWSPPLGDSGVFKDERYAPDGQDPQKVSIAQSGEFFRQGLEKVIRHLELSGKSVYIIEDSPTFDFDPLSTVQSRLNPLRGAIADLVETPSTRDRGDVALSQLSSNQIAERMIISQVARTHPEVHIFDLRSALCTSTGCRFAIGNQTLYIDPFHLSPLGSEIALTSFHLL
jgi:peptidoglycan/LPS O-acetylase OafA/YrhL